MHCPACGAVVAPTARFCEQCGARLPRRAGRPPGERDRRRPARRDGPLRRPRRLRPARGRARSRGRPAAGRSGARGDGRGDRAFDGTREKFIGDAVFAVFGWPSAHDDDALRATHCALAIRDRLARLEDPELDALQVRIGLATGEVVAAPRDVPGDMDWSLTGPAITTAARIQGLAEPGEILLDEPTRRATRKRLTIEDLGERVLRGQRRPVRLGRLLRRHRVPAVAARRAAGSSAGWGSGTRCSGSSAVSRRTGSAGSPSSPVRPASASRACSRTSRSTSAARVSPGPGSTTSRTAGRSRTGSAGRSPSSSPRSTGRTPGPSPGGSCSRPTSRRRTSAGGPARSPPSPATPPSRAGRPRRTSSRPTRSRSWPRSGR